MGSAGVYRWEFDKGDRSLVVGEAPAREASAAGHQVSRVDYDAELRMHNEILRPNLRDPSARLHLPPIRPASSEVLVRLEVLVRDPERRNHAPVDVSEAVFLSEIPHREHLSRLVQHLRIACKRDDGAPRIFG